MHDSKRNEKNERGESERGREVWRKGGLCAAIGQSTNFFLIEASLSSSGFSDEKLQHIPKGHHLLQFGSILKIFNSLVNHSRKQLQKLRNGFVCS